MNKNNQKGYIALVALLVVVAAGLTIGVAVSMRGIEEIMTSFDTSESLRAKNLANVCIEDGLERLRESWSSYSGTLSISDNSCIIDIVIDGSSATVTATGTIDIYAQKIQVQVDNSLNIISWQEY